ncbi:MAG: CHAT domain-containing protein [Chthoniobacter sp.]|uniref:CHAT domain-containing protein n=1 Tax=Chthoniobacter sp. TaxID=2510640 RepID=UPI0032AB40C4
MTTLRLTQSDIGPGKYRVEISLERDGYPRQIATADFSYSLTAQDREDLRWYLEDYLQHTADPAPQIAARIEGRITEMGVGLFKALFYANDDARDLWATLRDRLSDTRVEIITGVREATALPWELLRDPKTNAPLAVRTSAFVRTAHQTANRPNLQQSPAGPIRILLVICRPNGDEDVPFRSVASRLVKGLGESVRGAFHLDVLRPPTFEQLGKVLRAAKKCGNPYHVVHFDGHGAYIEGTNAGDASEFLRQLSPLMLSGVRAGSHGYLVFENPAFKGNHQLVDGTALGQLLVETNVPVLVLNACRSAHAETPPEPNHTAENTDTKSSVNEDIHAKVRAFGSFAQEVVDTGVAGVVAMRYNVYVVTAAQFVADLYESLVAGLALGEAVTLGRKQLVAQPLREIAYTPRPLQDWMVPIVYEAAPVVLFSKPVQKPEFKITVSADAVAPASGGLSSELEVRPDAGFFGRDETLLALDRAFDTQSIVVLHAFAGSGKTSTAAEFARWYHLTGGIKGPVLFTSFEQKTTLSQALNEAVGRVFSSALAQSGVHWLALPDEARRNVALQILAQNAVLWIWDNVEPIAGFPAGAPSRWSTSEQQALADFLRAARGTKAKFLLTSRRDERGWLGDLPMRIEMPPMPMQERVQLARALAQKSGRRLTEVADWIPLLRFTQGNPLTLTVLVCQALRDGLQSKEQIEIFVAAVRAGETAFEDEKSEGRSKSLGASLDYGFEHTFNKREQRQISLLYLFREFVQASTYGCMGDPANDWHLPELHGLSREERIALLDKASEAGLLTSHGKGNYSIHPILPWFLKRLFHKNYSNDETRATRAFVESIGILAALCYNAFLKESNKVQIIHVLARQKANILNARRLALSNGWWEALIRCMRGLRFLCSETDNEAEWKALVEEIVPSFVDPKTDGPLPGREDGWTFVTEYRVPLAWEEGRVNDAERLQLLQVDFQKRISNAAEIQEPSNLSSTQRVKVENLAVSLQDLARIQKGKGDPSCVDTYKMALDLHAKVANLPGVVLCAQSLAQSYLDVPKLRDLAKAEHWCRYAINNIEKSDSRNLSTCFNQLGTIAYDSFMEAFVSQAQDDERKRHLENALKAYLEALERLPSYAVGAIGQVQDRLATVYSYLGDIEQSKSHFAAAIYALEKTGQVGAAARTRLNFAVALLNSGRWDDALIYARAALQNYESLDQVDAVDIKTAKELIIVIEQRPWEKK